MNSRNRLCRLAALALALSCGPQPGEATSPWRSEDNLQGNVIPFGRWAVGCSNLRSCNAIAPVSDFDRTNSAAYIQMTLSGNFSDTDRWMIMRDGKVIATLAPSVARALAAELQKREGLDRIAITANGTSFAVPRNGFGDVLAALEEWRTTPPSAVSATSVITPLPAVRLERMPPPAELRSAAKRCPKGHMGQSMQAWRGPGGQTLWRAGCGNEELNSVSFWYVAGPQSTPPIEVQFEGLDPLAKLFNSWFEESSGYLRSVHYFGRWDSYTEDCGIYRAYAWTAQGMELVEQRLMPQCGTGIGPQGWITTYRATVLNGPDSGP